MWAVSEFRADGGATCHVPGSHLWPLSRTPEPDEIIPVPMPRGSVLLWVGSALHGAGASLSSAGTRHGLLLGYCLSWLRPEMNMHFSCPRPRRTGGGFVELSLTVYGTGPTRS